MCPAAKATSNSKLLVSAQLVLFTRGTWVSRERDDVEEGIRLPLLFHFEKSLPFAASVETQFAERLGIVRPAWVAF